MTPEQEAAYALDWHLPRDGLEPAVQLEYDRLKMQRELLPQRRPVAPRETETRGWPNTFNLRLHGCKITVWRELGSECCVRTAGWRTGSRSGCWPGRFPAMLSRKSSRPPERASSGTGCSRRG